MRTWSNWLQEEESGQGMVEYALILVLIAVAAVVSLTAVGDSLFTKYQDITNDIIAIH